VGGETRSLYRSGALAGVVAGMAMIYLATVGLIGTFAERPIVAGIGGEGAGVVTLGRLMLVGVPFVTGLVVAGRGGRRLTGTGPVGTAIATAALCGATAGAVFGLFLLLISIVDLSGIFIPLNERLVEILAFGQQAIVGAVIWIVLAMISALLAGLLELLDKRDRGAVLAAIGIVLLVALLEPILEPILGQLELDAISDFLFEEGGLTLAAAALIAGLVVAFMWATTSDASPVRRRVGGMSAERSRQLRLAGAVIGIAAVLAVPLVATGFVSLVLFNVGLYLMLALGLNIVVGYAGLLDLGYVAFFAVGAYTMGLLTAGSSALGGPTAAPLGPDWAFWLALPVVLLVAAAVGVLIGAPVLRLRGDYLAIVTLGFGEIARVLVESEALRPFLGGPNGVVGLPNLHIPIVGELSSPGEYYYPVLFFAAVAAYIAWRLSRSRTGRAWNAMREDESVAEATGINTTNYKLLAFALGGTLGGLAGAFFAVQLSTVFPGSFLLIVSITVLAIIILGGMGTIRGVIAGALILVGLPEALREFEEYRFLVYGAALVAMMILRPEGLFPSRVRREELHEDIETGPTLEEEQLPESGPSPAPTGATGS
jgi:branched-chain amino acid transport system permease protein